MELVERYIGIGAEMVVQQVCLLSCWRRRSGMILKTALLYYGADIGGTQKKIDLFSLFRNNITIHTTATVSCRVSHVLQVSYVCTIQTTDNNSCIISGVILCSTFFVLTTRHNNSLKQLRGNIPLLLLFFFVTTYAPST